MLNQSWSEELWNVFYEYFKENDDVIKLIACLLSPGAGVKNCLGLGRGTSGPEGDGQTQTADQEEPQQQLEVESHAWPRQWTETQGQGQYRVRNKTQGPEAKSHVWL